MSKVRLQPHEYGQYVTILCPACQRPHTINHSLNGWSFNGDIEKPTFGGSIGFHGEDSGGAYCHSSVENGNITYYNDSQHSLAGHTLELPEYKWPMKS